MPIGNPRRTNPRETADYIIFTKGSVTKRKNGITGIIDYSNPDAATVINKTLVDVPDGGRVRAVGTIRLDNSILIDGGLIGQKSLEFDFDEFYLGADVDALVLNNIEAIDPMGDYIYQSVKVRGRTITANAIPALDHTKCLLKYGTDDVFNTDVDIGTLVGNVALGHTIAVGAYLSVAGSGLLHNRLRLGAVRAVQHIFETEFTNDCWGSINDFDFGMCEGESPQQIHIKKTGTDGFHNNVIKGTFGYPSFWNPNALTPIWTIRLETDGTGKIEGLTFEDFNIYSAEDEIYRAIGNVTGIRFIGGMNRPDLTGWWYPGTADINFVTVKNPLSPFLTITKLTNLEVERRYKANFYEDFFGKQLSDPWRVVVTGGGTAAVVADQKGGICRLSSPTVATSDDVYIDWNSIWSIALPAVYEVGAKLNSVNSVYVEICELLHAPNAGIVLWYDDSVGVNYQISTKSGGVSTDRDSGIAADTNKHIFRFECHTHGGNHVHFFIASAPDWIFVETANSPITTNVPTANLESFFYINTNNAVLKTLDLDYVDIRQDR